MRPGEEEDARLEHRADFAGTAGDLVQAGQVHGGVHFHGPSSPAELIPRQLPGEVRGFVNRHAELGRLNEVLTGDPEEPPAAGLLVVTGTAGVGKTSLALHWAHRVRGHFPDGQLYVNLCGYDPGRPITAAEALDRFLRALGVPAPAVPVEEADRAAMYRSLLADRRVLVLLDNAASPAQVRPLLPGTAGSLVVVTSRSRFSGLVARDGAWRVPVDTLLESDAVALLRKVTAGSRDRDEPAELAELARLCARLPLALRIAAERAASRPHLRLADLIADLRDESGLWDALTAENDEEADAVRTVFAWSYRALGEDAARLFRLLGLHPGAEFGDGAAAALAGTSRARVRRLLDVLVGAHLLEHTAADRYQFHDLLRAYALDQAQQWETPASRQEAIVRAGQWYLHTLAGVLTLLAPEASFVRPDPVPGLAPLRLEGYREAARWFGQERANLVAVTRAAAEAGLDRIAWQLAGCLREIYADRNMFEDWITTARLGLDSARRLADRRGEAETLSSLGMACFQRRQLAESEHCHRAALAIREELGDEFGQARSINALGLLGLRHHRLTQAKAHFEQARELFAGLGDRRWIALLEGNLGEVCYELGALAEAERRLHAALTVFTEFDDRGGRGNTLFHLAMVHREQGRIAEAATAIETAMEIAEEADNQLWTAHWLLELARVRRAGGRTEEAVVNCRHAAAIQRQLGDHSREAMALDAAGEAYRELGRAAEAAQFHQVAAVTCRRLGDRWRLAIALDNLGTAQAAAELPEEAVRAWTEALSSLDGFADARAVALRERIAAKLAS